MSEIKYGLISKVDANVIEKTLDLIMDGMDMRDSVYTTQVGVFDGETDRGIRRYIRRTGIGHYHTAIDNEKDKPIIKPFPECNLIIGNSNEVYNQLEDNSQHLVLIDGNHSFPYVVSDFYCYKEKVIKGGYLCFHDAAPHAQGKDWQRMGDENDPDMSISVIKALYAVGLMWEKNYHSRNKGWEFVFHEWDENDRCGGMIVFKKLY